MAARSRHLLVALAWMLACGTQQNAGPPPQDTSSTSASSTAAPSSSSSAEVDASTGGDPIATTGGSTATTGASQTASDGSGTGTPEPVELDVFGILQLYPTAQGGLEWFSTSWANGIERSLLEGDVDPYDARMMWTNGAPNVPVRIDGNGQAWMEDLTTSGRMFISGPWINTEMTVYLLREVDDETGDIQLRSRSNHQTDCGFGNYEVKWHDIERRVSVEVEPLHPIYRRHLDEHDWAGGIPREQWIGFKQITRTVDRTGHVTVEGYVNYGIDLEAQNTTTGWRKLTEFTFTGENVTFVDGGDYEAERQACIGQGDEVADDLSASTRWTAPGQWCWIRINGVSHARFKFFSVREIDPL